MTNEGMVREIKKMGIKDRHVLAAMRRVDRREFVPQDWREAAYADRPLPIGWGQTISQPYTVARMCELVVEHRETGKDRVLEVGMGSGYQTAVLARLFKEVYSLEIIEQLARQAREKLAKLKFGNVEVKVGDGKLGWSKFAPYDGIIVAAGADQVPQQLVDQLGEDGRILIPVQGELTRGVKRNGKMAWESLGRFSFVPLV